MRRRPALEARELLHACLPAAELQAPSSNPTVDVTSVRKTLQRRKALIAHTVYECSACGERFIGERRCPECGLFCHAVGLGGSCPECDSVVLLDDLLGEGVIATA